MWMVLVCSALALKDAFLIGSFLVKNAKHFKLVDCRGGSGQFFCPLVGFRVFGCLLWSPSGQRNIGSSQSRVQIFCTFQSILAGSSKKLPKFKEMQKISNNSLKKNYLGLQQVLVYREFDYRDPRNTGIFLMVTINLEYQDFSGKICIPWFFQDNPDIRG